MNPIIERRLEQTARQLQFVRAIQVSAMALCLTTLVFLVIGASIDIAWITQRGTAWGLVIVTITLSILAWFVALLLIAGSPLDKAKVAHETERTTPALMDRLHTLSALAPRRGLPQVESYAERIEQQSVSVVSRANTSTPLVSRDSRRWIVAALALTLITWVYYAWSQPFRQLGVAAITPSPTDADSKSLEFPPSPEEQKKDEDAFEPWIEARVLEPGQDLVVTRYETIPLRVEAATSGELSRMDLRTTRNGDSLPRRDLGLDSGDARFARHEVLLDLEILEAGDWDVLSYHATAESRDGLTAASRIYFVEVRPLREEIEQLPGGVEGEPYRVLSELTNMVDSQQDAIRAAHRLNQVPPDQIDSQMISELAQTQQILKSATEYLNNALPEKSKQSPFASELAQASEAFQNAADQFGAGQIREAQEAAQKAMGRLATARKEIHKAVQNDPDVLSRPPASVDPLANIAERMNEQDQLQKNLETAADQAARLAEEQDQLAQKIKPCDVAVHKAAAQQEKQLREKFDQFRNDHAQACQKAGAQSASAETALGSATEAIDHLAAHHDKTTHQKARNAAENAASSLKQLASSLRQQADGQPMEQAKQLEQALDAQIEYLERLEQNPESATQEQLERAAENMQATTDQLKKLAEDSATRDKFSDELRDTLKDENKERLDKQ